LDLKRQLAQLHSCFAEIDGQLGYLLDQPPQMALDLLVLLLVLFESE
jgi:hypothetical protein